MAVVIDSSEHFRATKLRHPTKAQGVCDIIPLERHDKYRHFFDPLLRISAQPIFDARRDGLEVYALDIAYSEEYALKLLYGDQPPVDRISIAIRDNLRKVWPVELLMVVIESAPTKIIHAHCLFAAPPGLREDFVVRLEKMRNLAPLGAICLKAKYYVHRGVPTLINLGKVDYLTKQMLPIGSLEHRKFRPEGERRLYRSKPLQAKAKQLRAQIYEDERLGNASNAFEPTQVNSLRTPVDFPGLSDEPETPETQAGRGFAPEHHEKVGIYTSYKQFIPRKLQAPSGENAINKLIADHNPSTFRKESKMSEQKKSTPKPNEVVESLSTSNCYLWTGATSADGYPVFGNKATGKTTRVNRHILTETKGPPPSDKHHAAHSCGNRLCFNPDHLTWKTASENSQDRLYHHTHSRDGNISPVIALAIHRTKGIIPGQILSEKLETVSKSMVEKIRSGDRWDHLTSLTNSEQQEICDSYRATHAPLTPNDIWAWNTLTLLTVEPILGPSLLRKQVAEIHHIDQLKRKMQRKLMKAANDGDLCPELAVEALQNTLEALQELTA